MFCERCGKPMDEADDQSPPTPKAIVTDAVGIVRDVLYRRFPTEIHADLLRAAADEIVTALHPNPEASEIMREASVSTDDEETRAFIDGWNARLDHTEFDMALHFWNRRRAGI
jgi:hypothetical protein